MTLAVQAGLGRGALASLATMSAVSLNFLSRIEGYVAQNDLRGEDLPSAASDVLDCLAIRSELDELIDRRLLSVVKLARGDTIWPGDSCGGTRYTVDLTKNAVRLFWPDRMTST
ncbi:hypothetical protein ABIC83_002399 [Roseateles asaccharophilus]|uniref:hypothetical protein n=1 Tax=Roseateles asaccharophilus TaxID=582607 RepID=UPI003833E872